MSVSGIGTYGIDAYDTNTVLKKSSSTSLDMQDFLTLLVGQLKNQDVTNPMDDTAFISQMAQFTTLQAMEELSRIAMAQYGASLLGKTAVVAKFDDTGKYVQDEGVIERVDFTGDETEVSLNGCIYELSSVMEVLQSPEPDASDAADGGAADEAV